MESTPESPTLLGRFVSAVLFTAILAITHQVKAESHRMEPTNRLPQGFYPVSETEQAQATQDFYTSKIDSLVLEQAMQVSGLPLSQLEIVAITPGDWSDGCIGMREPAQFCTMALVPGWYVVVSDGQQAWAYHTTRRSVQLSPVRPIIPGILPVWPPQPFCWRQNWCDLIPGFTQDNPLMPDRNEQGSWIFDDLPSGRWFDPPMTPGFRYTMTSDSLFTEILDFPTGIDSDNRFTVTVGDSPLGEFAIGQRVNFVNILGAGVKEFEISGIDSGVDASNPMAFPIRLGFTTPRASLTMTPLTHESVPEPSAFLGMLLVGAAGYLSRKWQT